MPVAQYGKRPDGTEQLQYISSSSHIVINDEHYSATFPLK